MVIMNEEGRDEDQREVEEVLKIYEEDWTKKPYVFSVGVFLNEQEGNHYIKVKVGAGQTEQFEKDFPYAKDGAVDGAPIEIVEGEMDKAR